MGPVCWASLRGQSVGLACGARLLGSPAGPVGWASLHGPPAGSSSRLTCGVAVSM